MYDVYHWEAHPDNQYPEPTTLEQRIKHYEDYVAKYNVTLPGLVDDGNCSVSRQKFSARWTSIFVIDLDKEIAHRDDFTGTYPESGWVLEAYPRLDSKLDELLPDDLEAPVVSVTSPGISDVLVVGTEHEVTWTATDNVGVVSRAICFTADNGSNWTSVDSTSGNSGSYTWTVPDEVSEECKIKVFAYDAVGNVGNSESEVFEIEPETNIIFNSEMAHNLIKFKKTSGSFMVYIPFSGDYAVTISDVHGKKLSTFTASGNKQWHTISNVLSSGMHILSIKNSGKTFIKKFWYVK